MNIIRIKLTLLLLLASISPGSAKIIRVKSDAMGSGNGETWIDAFPELRDALDSANPGDKILVAKGTYFPADAPDSFATFRLKKGVLIRGGFDGNETGDQPNDPMARSILSGKFPGSLNRSQYAYHVVTAELFDEVDETTVLDSLIITGGSAGGKRDQGDQRGAGILLLGASPTLRNIAVVDNMAIGKGGGIYFSVSSSKMDRCFVGGNTSGDEGGGVFIGSGCNLEITNSVLSGNQNLGGVFGGGGISSPTSDSIFNLINCTITGNFSTRFGGGVSNKGIHSGVYNSIIYGNTVGGGGYDPEVTDDFFREERFLNTIVRGDFDDLQPPQAIDVDPLFVNPAGPDGIPGTLDDDLRLLRSSPAINAGDQSHLPNGFTLDFQNQPRFVEAEVDIGAIEGSIPATFALLHPGLAPNGDVNQNGVSNFAEYAMGNDPEQINQSNLGLQASPDRILYQVRNNAADVEIRLQKSADLDFWSDLVEGVDFSVGDSVILNNGVRFFHLNLSEALTATSFFRQIFESAP